MILSIWIDIYSELSPEDALEKLLARSPFRNFEYSCGHLEMWVKQGKSNQTVKKIKDLLNEYQANFLQLHAPIFNFLEDEDAEKKLKWCEDSLELASRLNIPWVVMHAGNIKGWREDKELEKEVIEQNIKTFKRLLKIAQDFNTGIAIENMHRNKFTSRVSELQLLLDSLSAPNVGICWDTGHANLAFDDQVKEIKKIKDDIVATHITDNRGKNDDHIFPLRGEIDWEKLIPVINKLDVPFNYEIPGVRAYTPLELRHMEVNYGYELGKYLFKQYSVE